MPFKQKFLQHLKISRLINPGAKLIVAVSGGADSMALLYALIHVRRELAFELIIAHYDHHLRPSSKRDRHFVQQVADKVGCLFLTEVNRQKCPKKGSVEEFARDLRYDFLLRMAKQQGAEAVLTAHTRNDLAETVLMRLLRGTGLMGLQAILPRRFIHGIVLIRPLLPFVREELENFLKFIGIDYINDPTNLSLDFTRNKVRQLLIPLLEKEFQTGVQVNLARLAETAALDYNFIEEQALGFLRKSSRKTANAVAIKKTLFQKLHPALRKAVLRSGYTFLLQKTQPLNMAHINHIDQIIGDNQEHSVKENVSLPNGLKFQLSKSHFVLKL